jgi:hypothetical protein
VTEEQNNYFSPYLYPNITLNISLLYPSTPPSQPIAMLLATPKKMMRLDFFQICIQLFVVDVQISRKIKLFSA